ncbi:hypothetical protein [Streptomyces sp. NBC_00566]|uniref:hypothetical protein n=1 Tax=Streptomyces sp. NBC_00566 TaxID=2975778 RepID=UPI002E8247BA|nr:hypothetical protein [Streptomyces sp. NBC_00566]WUB88226.1 hypothetical protein OG812_17255 [Streptomyces sp. NBC_00566]
MSTRTLPPHGSLSRARHHHCTCQPCRERSTAYMQHRSRMVAYGRWQPYVDAEPIRQHVALLRACSLGIPRIRQLSGTSGGAMSKLLYGANGKPPSARVRTLTADRLTGIRPSLELALPTARVDGVGTRRRLRALVAVGWPQIELAHRLGMDKKSVNDQVNTHGLPAYASTALAVRALYDELWNVDPASQGVGERWIAEAKARAHARGWAPPAAWDDDYIDSPAAVPDLGERVDRYAAISEDALWLMDEQGYTRELAAHRLGITQRHLDRALAWAREGVAA